MFFSLKFFEVEEVLEGEGMVRLWEGVVALSELCVSSLVHMIYGLYIFGTAVASDVSQALSVSLRPSCDPSSNTDVVVVKGVAKGDDNLPPIVLVHGIFGFGHGVCISIYY